MKWFDFIVRMFVLTLGSGLRWMREELRTAQVSIRLTDGCLTELVRDADAAVMRARSSSAGQPYAERLRKELALRARFIQRWTGSDENLSAREEETLQDFVR